MKVGSILPKDDFCGTTFPTPQGGILTVVGIVGKSGSNKKYGLVCSVCHKDAELFSDYFESVKGSLVKGLIPCGCSSKPLLNEQQRIILISRECKKRGHEFRGFVGGKYNGNCTYLILYCPEHGEWRSNTYNNYMNNGRGCPVCGIESQKIQNPEELITEEATKRGHEFRGFVGGKYNGVGTFLIMYCPEHGEWGSTTYKSYMNNGRGCPSCGIESQITKQKIQNPEELITKEATKRGHEFRGFVGGKFIGIKNTYPIMYCPEHGEWKSSTYDSYMRGHGCPSCTENGYSQQKPGTFYIIHYEYEGEVFLKYGITNRDTTSRMAEHYKGMKNVTCTILKEYYFEDGSIPFKMEQAVNTKYKGGVTTCLTSGNTETAPHYELDEVKLLAESVLKGNIT